MGTTGDDTAAHRLRTLATHYIEPARTGTGIRGPRPTEARPPLNINIVSHMAASVAEIVDRAHADAPHAGQAPAVPDGIYQWWRDNTRHLDTEKQQARETVIYRQGLEHAIAMGDFKVIRRHPCPECGCLGMFWRATVGRAACSNLDCTDQLGLTRTWNLARLAHEHIAREFARTTRATI
ncbi:hypothetical protein [Streptomyces sp. NPDC095613]|uniref:hypothetical protein n=1 Tax=Streptomyces sp. NPDC095613 TaxID=3155540 RepID=UPI0033236752